MGKAQPAEDVVHTLGPPPRRVILLVTAIAAVAATLHLVFVPAPTLPDDGSAWLLALTVAAGFAVAEVLSVNVRFGRQAFSLSLSELPLVAGLIMLDPFLLVIAWLAGVMPVLWLYWRQPPTKLLFNAAHYWLLSTAAIGVWQVLLGEASVTDPRGWLAVLATSMVIAVLSGSLILLAMALTEGGLHVKLSSILLPGVVSALSNASFALVAAFVFEVDGRGIWTLLWIALGFLFAYRAYTVLQRRNASLQQVAEFSRRVGRDLHADAVASTVVHQVRGLLQVDVVELVLFDDGRGPLRLLSRRTADLQVERTASRALVESFMPAGWDGTPVLAARHSRSPALRSGLAHTGLKDALAVPLEDEGRLIGTLLVADREGDVETFDEHERTMLVALANHASTALRNGRLADRLRSEAHEKEHQALHDRLTGLPNRTLFQSRLAELVASGEQVAVLLMDLDRFKEINDTLGHHLGDQLLVEVSHRLLEALPPDTVAARLGGDEFAVCLPRCGEREALTLSECIRRVLARPVVVDQIAVEAEVSIGAAVAPDHGADASVLLQRADVAMYAAKASHSGFEVYDVARDQYSPQRLALLSELRRAIERGELVNYYQPKVTLDARQVLGVEALVRWSHPRHGLIPPDEFVPMAEQTGLIRPLTLSVLREALSQCARWRDRGLRLGVAVNLSPRSFLDHTLADDVEELLAAYGLPRRVLTLEITEGSMMADPERSVAVLRRLSVIGVELAIDDFGTGYSSLAYLKRLPVDEIKIDKSFVQSIVADPSDAAIVRAVVELSNRLGKRVVAEGVEDQAAFEQLAQLGCDAAQGYWMSRPVPASAIEAWVLDWEQATSQATPLRRPSSAAVNR